PPKYVPRAAVPDDPLAGPVREGGHRGDAGSAAAGSVVPVEPGPAARARPGPDGRGHAPPRGLAPRTAGLDRPHPPAVRGAADRVLRPDPASRFAPRGPWSQ